MKVIFFITHKTLGLDHAKLALSSLGDSYEPMKFDKMIIYNTHQDELPNELLFQMCRDYGLYSIVNEILEFDGVYPSTYRLTSDIRTIGNYVFERYQNTDKIWLWKSDCILSKYLVNDMNKLDTLQSFCFTPAFIVAKKRVTDNEIIEYCHKPYLVLSDHETFFNEDESQSKDNDHRNRIGEKATDFNIKFISCTVKRDFSNHYLTVDCLRNINIGDQTWGGVGFASLSNKWVGTSKGFVVHKYHNIVSESRPLPREGTIEEYMLS